MGKRNTMDGSDPGIEILKISVFLFIFGSTEETCWPLIKVNRAKQAIDS